MISRLCSVLAPTQFPMESPRPYGFTGSPCEPTFGEPRVRPAAAGLAAAALLVTCFACACGVVTDDGGAPQEPLPFCEPAFQWASAKSIELQVDRGFNLSGAMSLATPGTQ